MMRLASAAVLASVVTFLSPVSLLASGGNQSPSDVGPAGGSDSAYCPPPVVDTFTICRLDTVFDTLAFYVADLSDPEVALEILDGPGVLEVEKSDSLYGYYHFVPPLEDTYPVRFLFIGPGADSTIHDYRYVTYFNDPPVISCPGPQAFYTCEPGISCFDVDAVDPEDGDLTFHVISGNAVAEGRTICIDGAATGHFDVVVEVVDECGNSDTCSVRVDVYGNQPPQVNLEEDFAVTLCEMQRICFAASVSDSDEEPLDVSLNFGSYLPVSKQIAFTPDTSGVYTFILTAVDTCGAVGADTAHVTVHLNEPPLVDLGNDTSIYLCSSAAVCLDVVIEDHNLRNVYPSRGYYDNATGQLCFDPPGSGRYSIVVVAVDSCDRWMRDTVVVDVTIGEPPYVHLGSDFSVELCQLTEVCVWVVTISTFKSLETNLGEYDEVTRKVCFSPDTAGVYTLIVEVTDPCDSTVSDTVRISVDLMSPPTVTGLRDSVLYLCLPRPVCLPVTVDDPDNDLDSMWTSVGTLKQGQVCFVPYDSGDYVVIVSAVDSCGLLAADTAVVTIVTDQGITIECPSDTTVFTCREVDTFCFPISGIPAYAEVETWGINTWYDSATGQICFWSQCAHTNHITVFVTTPCNTYECEFTVTVLCNRDPLVFLPPDTSLSMCELTDICLPVGILDPDNNLAAIRVQGGYFNPITSRVCFTPDTVGTYLIRVEAEDDCGAIGFDEIRVVLWFNTAPHFEYEPIDTIVYQCLPESICVPVPIVDPDDNLVDVTTSGGAYDLSAQRLCLLPDTTGRYCMELVAVDSCGAADTVGVCLGVVVGAYVDINCPVIVEPIGVLLCEPGDVCWPLEIFGQDFQVQVNLGGTWADGTLCFPADADGLYEIEIVAVSDCSNDTCHIPFNVIISDSTSIICPGDDSVVVCGSDTTVSFPLQVSTNVFEVTASPPAYISDSEVIVPLQEPGDLTIRLTAVSQCGRDSCDFTITTVFNRPPTVDAGPDTTLLLCELDTICLPFSAIDPDGNIAEILVHSPPSLPGVVSDGFFCFAPSTYGSFQIVLIAVDECQAADTDAVGVTVEPGGGVAIGCPAQVDTLLCDPDTVCVSVPISPADADVTVLPKGTYDPATQQVCLFADSTGMYDITVTATATCGSDTCRFAVNVTLEQAPQLSCPKSVDTVLCLNQPETLCFAIDTAGDVSDIQVGPVGYLSNGSVCLEVTEPGVYELQMVATGPCGVTVCSTVVSVAADSPPELFLPASLVIERGETDTSRVFIDGIFSTDDQGVDSLIKTCGPGLLELVTADSGVLSFLPDAFRTYEFCFEAYDGCSMMAGTLLVEVVPISGACFRLAIDGGNCVPVGVRQQVNILIESNQPMGGFDLLINFDASAMMFQTATIDGTAIEEWEYFQYRLGSDDCGIGCPPGLVGFVAIADINDALNQHPPPSALTPNGVLISTTFLVANNQNLGGFYLPINFIWYSCGDNGISDPSGDNLYVDVRILGPELNVIWDEEDDSEFPEADRVLGVGAPDECLVGGGPGKPRPIRCIEFINGGICVIHPESLDVRGDVNLNGIPYEIADAVVFINYFIYGFSAFNINREGQIAATDVNADGLTLSVGDLVFLIRVIVGDADPIPKLTPYTDELILSTDRDEDVIVVTTDAVGSIGAALLVFEVEGDFDIGRPALGPDAENMDLDYSLENGELRILIYNLGKNLIPPGENRIIEIPCVGRGTVSPGRVEIVDYQGRPYCVAKKTPAVPTGFELEQNYPNPFNPSTMISFALPHTTDWKLHIYNISGRLVREYRGFAEAGVVSVEWDGFSTDGQPVASGVYLYRLETADFTASKKMMLLK